MLSRWILRLLDVTDAMPDWLFAVTLMAIVLTMVGISLTVTIALASVAIR